MKAYVSGANGFIGKAVCKFLLGERYEVIKHDRQKGDYSEMQDCDVVVHLSAYGNHYNQTNPIEMIERNQCDLWSMVAVARPSERLKKFYNISTSSVTLPVQTMYSASKLFGETFINSLKDERFVNVRPYSVYGEGEAAHRFIPTVIRHLKSGEKMSLDVNAVHDWVHVCDFVKAMFDGHTSIGSGFQVSNITVVNLLEDISGMKLNYDPMQMRNYDTANWKCPDGVPSRPLIEGLKQTWEASL